MGPFRQAVSGETGFLINVLSGVAPNAKKPTPTDHIPSECNRYRAVPANDTSTAGDNVITDGRLDWNKLKKQLIDIEKNTTIKASGHAELMLAQAKGIPGSAREGGVPGQQVVDMSKADPDQGTELKAFVGGEVEVTVAGQVEWKSPETDEFAPFAKIAPARLIQYSDYGAADW
jgi:hypothetical protein